MTKKLLNKKNKVPTKKSQKKTRQNKKKQKNYFQLKKLRKSKNYFQPLEIKTNLFLKYKNKTTKIATSTITKRKIKIKSV
jgi:hypothetical protein